MTVRPAPREWDGRSRSREAVGDNGYLNVWEDQAFDIKNEQAVAEFLDKVGSKNPKRAFGVALRVIEQTDQGPRIIAFSGEHNILITHDYNKLVDTFSDYIAAMAVGIDVPEEKLSLEVMPYQVIKLTPLTAYLGDREQLKKINKLHLASYPTISDPSLVEHSFGSAAFVAPLELNPRTRDLQCPLPATATPGEKSEWNSHVRAHQEDKVNYYSAYVLTVGQAEDLSGLHVGTLVKTAQGQLPSLAPGMEMMRLDPPPRAKINNDEFETEIVQISRRELNSLYERIEALERTNHPSPKV